jgi:hypothetical protein
MVIAGKLLYTNPVGVGVLQGSPISPILCAIETAGLIKRVNERVRLEGVSFLDDRGLLVTGEEVNLVIKTLELWKSESIELGSTRDRQVDTVKIEAALLTCRKGYKNNLQLKLTAKNTERNSFFRINPVAT